MAVEFQIGGDGIFEGYVKVLSEILITVTGVWKSADQSSFLADTSIKIKKEKEEEEESLPLNIYFINENEFVVYYMAEKRGKHHLSIDYKGTNAISHSISVIDKPVLQKGEDAPDYEFRGEGLHRSLTNVPFLVSVFHDENKITSLLSLQVFYVGDGGGEKNKVSVSRFEGKDGVCFRYLARDPGLISVMVLVKGFAVMKREVTVRKCQSEVVTESIQTPELPPLDIAAASQTLSPEISKSSSPRPSAAKSPSSGSSSSSGCPASPKLPGLKFKKEGSSSPSTRMFGALVSPRSRRNRDASPKLTKDAHSSSDLKKGMSRFSPKIFMRSEKDIQISEPRPPGAPYSPKKSRVSRVAELKTGSLTKANSSASGMSRSNSVQAELSTAGGPPPPSTTTLKLEENFSLTPASCSYGAASPQISPKPASPTLPPKPRTSPPPKPTTSPSTPKKGMAAPPKPGATPPPRRPMASPQMGVMTSPRIPMKKPSSKPPTPSSSSPKMAQRQLPPQSASIIRKTSTPVITTTQQRTRGGQGGQGGSAFGVGGQGQGQQAKSSTALKLPPVNPLSSERGRSEGQLAVSREVNALVSPRGPPSRPPRTPERRPLA